MAFCTVNRRLFTSGADATIRAWTLQREAPDGGGGYRVSLRPHAVMRRHTEVVQELLCVRDDDVEGGCCLVSAALDRCVHLWDTAACSFVQVGGWAGI
ncbi:unnamed protein product, partial [Phaeothamnion confervicola]